MNWKNLIILLFIAIKIKHFYNIRGAFNKFPDFFVRALKIIVDTWKFSMLLLYILWDDWPIFRISGSNEQLQQEFQKTVTDFFDMKGKNYMVYADPYTGWVEVALMYSGNAKTECDTLW